MKLNAYLCAFAALLFTGCASHNHELLYKEKPAFYAYIIGDVKTGHIDESYAADVCATPASCQKTITTLLALKALGSEYRYETKLFCTNKKDSTQDVVISFSGDPNFTSTDLLALLKPLEGTTVNKIMLDASVFKTPTHSENIMICDIGTRYAQPVSSINIDKNLITLTITPTKPAKLADIKIDTPYKIDSSILTTSAASCVKTIWDGRHIKITGNINASDLSLERQISPQDIDNHIFFKVIKVLKTLNIKGTIKVIHDKNQLPPNLRLLNIAQSQPLKELLKPALKQSDNLVFDCLYLTILNSQSTESIDDWNKGDRIFKDLLKKHFAIECNEALFVDGSGLSRYNRIQPKKLFELLRQGFLMPEFVEALPKPGEEKSTLEKRNNLPDNVRAKTGFLSGVSCLCGYSNQNDKTKAFVIMTNSFAPPAKELFDVVDKFIKKRLGE